MDPQWTHPSMAPKQPAKEPIWWRCTLSEFIAKYQEVRPSTSSAEVVAIGEFFTHMISKGTFPEMEPGSGSYEVLLLKDVTEMFDYFALEYAKRKPAPGIDDSLFEGGDLTGDEVDHEDALMAENDGFEDDGLAYLDSLVGADSLLREDTFFRALLSDDALLPEDALPLSDDTLVLDDALGHHDSPLSDDSPLTGDTFRSCSSSGQCSCSR